MNTSEREQNYLLHMVSEFYKTPHAPRPDLSQVYISRLLTLAISNGMGYHIAKQLSFAPTGNIDGKSLSLLIKMVQNGDEKYRQIKDILKNMDSCLNEYLLIKTYRTYPRIGNDVDVLVNDFDQSIKLLINANFKLMECSNLDQRAILLYNGEMKIHLHGNVSWAKRGSTFIDNELIWNNPRLIKQDQIQTKIPNVEADFLMHIAHINYETLHITLSELLYLYDLANKVHWDIVLDQARKYNWGRTLRHTIKLLDTIHHTLYHQPCPFTYWDFKHRGFGKIDKKSLPISLPRKQIVLAFLEKRLLAWVVCNKLLKSTSILISGDTYMQYNVPPEKSLIQ